MQRLEAKWYNFTLFTYHVGPKDWTQVITLEHFYQVTYFIVPVVSFKIYILSYTQYLF